MTVQVHPDVCLVPLLQRVAADGLHVKLYVNNYTPVFGTVLADFTEKGLGTGYSAGGIAVAGADFVLSGTFAHKGILQALPVSWTPASTDGQSVYGYYYTDTTDTILLGCARFDPGPIVWTAAVPVAVTPVFGDNSLFL